MTIASSDRAKLDVRVALPRDGQFVAVRPIGVVEHVENIEGGLPVLAQHDRVERIDHDGRVVDGRHRDHEGIDCGAAPSNAAAVVTVSGVDRHVLHAAPVFFRLDGDEVSGIDGHGKVFVATGNVGQNVLDSGR